MNDENVIKADHDSRNWRYASYGRVAPGTVAHKEMFCHLLLDTFNPYRPAVIEWPQLSDAERTRVTSLPIWDIAVQTEGKARINMLSYAAAVSDPLVRQALELNGFEEGRHKEVLGHLVAAYGIALEPEPAYAASRDVEWAYMKTGYSECIDSFFAFGLFELAKRSGFFPPALVETFEPVMQEECRHILFFSNWAAWHRANQPWWRRPYFALRVAAVWVSLIWERMKTANDVGGHNFTATGSQSMGLEISMGGLLSTCLAENDRRMSGYDPRLLRPRLMPTVSRWAYGAARFLGRA